MASTNAASIDDLLWSLGHASAFAAVPSLGRMRDLLARLGNPHVGLPVLHIGGTAGKGSTVTIAAALLAAAGYKTGLHTKPHLARVNERIVVNGTPISDEDLRALIAQARPAAEAVQPTWYELTVALALLHFRQIGVDIAVIEVGMGGTWDGTNVVTPRVAVLTNVGLDHTEILGDTVEQIARDKVAIIKPGCIAITGVTQPSVQEIVAARAASVGVPLLRDGHEIAWRVLDSGQFGADFSARVNDRVRAGLHLGLIGAHQIANATLAIAATDALARDGMVIPDEVLRETLPTIRIPGRQEIVGQSPTIVLDGAHNPDKLGALLQTLRHTFSGGRKIFVVGFTRRHDYRAMLAMLAPIADHLVLTSFAMHGDFGPGRGVEVDELETILASLHPKGTWQAVPTPADALAAAQAVATRDDTICVTGSLYLVGAVRGAYLPGLPS